MSIEQHFRDVRHCVERYTLDEYVNACALRELTDYSGYVPYRQAILLKRITANHGPEIACLYNQLALLQLSARRIESEDYAKLPEPLRDYTEDWFKHIYKEIIRKNHGYFDLLQPAGPRRDDLEKDFAVCIGRSIPIGGAWVVEKRRLVEHKLFNNSRLHAIYPETTPGAYLRHKLKRAAGVRESLRSLRKRWYTLTGEYKNYFEIHTSYRHRRYFSEKYLNTAYCNIAILLDDNPDIVGLYRKSWFLDPKVIELEPGLGFLLHTPINNGAIHKPVSPVQSKDINKVLAHSRKRTSAYESGHYQPWDWAYLWLRDDLQTWARQVI